MQQPTTMSPSLTQRKFERGIEIIGIILPKLIDSPEKIEALYCCLQDLTDEEFGRGVKILALTHKEFYPNTNVIALIRDYALGDETKTGVEAWGEVQRAIVEMGRAKLVPYPDVAGLEPEKRRELLEKYDEEKGQPLQFVVADPIADRIARAMGIKQLRYSQTEEIDRAHFIRAYEQLRDADARRRVAGRGAL